jgi:formylglycine-generating enzyme required for sulfatase activity
MRWRLSIWSAAAAAIVACASAGQVPQKGLREPIAASPSFAKRALVIGVSNYENVAPLGATARDALAVADFLEKRMGFPKESIVLMTDLAATPERLRPTARRVRRQVQTLLEGVTEQSEVVVFFSGHGVRHQDEDWLVPLDGDPQDIAGSCVSYTKLRNRLETLRPRRALLLVDACRNLLGGKSATGSGFGEGAGAKVEEIAELLSCRPREVSREGKAEDFAAGVFTHYLLRGLGGDPEAVAPGGDVVTFDSLKQYVQGKVSQYVSSKYGDSQNPDGRASLGAMVLARVPAPVKPAETVTKPAETPTKPAETVTKPAETSSARPAALGIGSRSVNPKDGAEMCWVPEGEFIMGSSNGDDDEKPKRTVYLDGFWMYKHEVTVAQYRRFCAETGRKMPDPPSWGWKEDHPIVNVSWDDAQAYADWAGVQLPTEAQWEKAARGTDGRTFPWGDTFDPSKAVCSVAPRKEKSTAPVGSIPSGASPYGCLDMSGNVWEWCSDWYDGGYYARAPNRNPENRRASTDRVQRGGSWYFGFTDHKRASYRDRCPPDIANVISGFRCSS